MGDGVQVKVERVERTCRKRKEGVIWGVARAGIKCGATPSVPSLVLAIISLLCLGYARGLLFPCFNLNQLSRGLGGLQVIFIYHTFTL